MTTLNDTIKEPLWLAMERKILEYAPDGARQTDQEKTLKTIAADLDQAGHNVSLHGGNYLQLRYALEETARNGRPLLRDLNEAIEKLTFEEVENTRKAAASIIDSIGISWPRLKDANRKPAILGMVENTRLGFLVKKAKELPEGEGIRYLIASGIVRDVIVESLGVSQDRYTQETAAIAAEKAERDRVKSLLDAVAGKTDEERIKHLINKDVSDALIIEIAGVDQAAVDKVRLAMEKELEEKRRLAEEEARKKAAAEAGPSLEEISMEDRLTHIEAIRDILDLCDKEAEIRQMCTQSNVPKCLIDIAVSDPDRLDALEAEAEG
jgi:hypothetical protein